MTDALQFSVVIALKRTENRGVTVGKTSQLNYEVDPQVILEQNQVSVLVPETRFRFRYQYTSSPRTNEGINLRYLKNWADVADKICFRRT
jgi:hypothetical protein